MQATEIETLKELGQSKRKKILQKLADSVIYPVP
jgi:hypothetical protein